MKNHRLRTLLVALGVAILASIWVQSALAASYTVTDLGVLPGGIESTADAINNSGQIVGWTAFPASGDHGFLWQNGVMTDLGTLGGNHSQATGINDNGQVTGYSELVYTGWNTVRAFLWQNGVMTNLDDASATPGVASSGFGIDSSGAVVGGGQQNDSFGHEALVFAGSTRSVLPSLSYRVNGDARAINDAGQVVGFGYDATGVQVPVLWQSGGTSVVGSLGGQLEGGAAYDINNGGEIVGWSQAPSAYDPNGRPHAFSYSAGVMADLGTLPNNADSVAYGVNASGVVVGESIDIFCGCHPAGAFVYTNGQMSNLNDLIPAGSGWRLVTARAINGSGQIVGDGYENGQHRAFLLTPAIPTDTTAPSVSCGSADTAWHGANVGIACSASDSRSGLANAGDARFSLATSVPAGTENANASTGSRQVCDNAGNCTSVGPIAGNKVDMKAPATSCGSADGVWHAANVGINCAASDAGSGLASGGDASFSLSTSVPVGSEDGNAATGSRLVCDNAGNCATAGPVTGNKIDRKPPSVAAPANQTVNATSPSGAAVSFVASASDGSDPSPSLTCRPALGSTFAIGQTTVTCTATDHAGNTASASFVVTVKGAAAQIVDLANELAGYLKLPPLSTTLQSYLQSTANALLTNKPLACSALTQFINVVNAAPTSLLTTSQKTQLVTDAKRIKAVIGC